jgi:hypothetical protein
VIEIADIEKQKSYQEAAFRGESASEMQASV